MRRFFDAVRFNGLPSALFGGQTTRLHDTEAQPVVGRSATSGQGESARVRD